MLTNQIDDIIIGMPGYIARNRMVRLEDITAALGSIELS